MNLFFANFSRTQDFREIKRENEKKIERLEARLIEVSSLPANIEPLLEKAVSNLAHLDELYSDGDTKWIGHMGREFC